MFTQIVFGIFIASTIVQLCYAFYFFLRVFFIKNSLEEKKSSLNAPAVSIIICAKNEAENLEQNLPLILAQRYENAAGKANYEVIVVNDASSDETASVLQRLEQQFENLWSVQINADEERNFPGKKFALSKGVQYASNNFLLLTDADCKPASEYWLSLMMSPMQYEKKIVAGYGRFDDAPGLLNKFIRWETLHTFIQYAGYAKAGLPYMAVGRNLASTKEIYLQAQQASVWNKLPSGDDDLMMRTMADAINTEIIAVPDAHTVSNTQESFHAWIKQKQRHLSTGKYYLPKIKLLLGVYALSHADMWLGFFLLLFAGMWKIGFAILLIRCLVYWGIWFFVAKKLGEKKLGLFFPLMDIGWLFYNFLFAPYIIFKNKQQWK